MRLGCKSSSRFRGAAQKLKRQWIGIDISPTACRVMAKRLRDVCALPESEPLWRA
jgi:DNA modification methylase